MHILIIGSRGQLGRALMAQFAGDGTQLTGWDREDCDVTDPAIIQAVAELAPNVVINAAAWTDVDGAEENPDAAYAANALGPGHLAAGCRQCHALFVQVSTNEVFAGAPGRVYREYDLPDPAGVYARSKWAGEAAARQATEKLLIARVAWLFGPGGNNFPSKIVAAADKFGALRLVADEFGNPTYAPDAAAALRQLVQRGVTGIVHLVNEGMASRFDLAATVLAQSGRGHIPLTPIAAHPRFARSGRCR